MDPAPFPTIGYKEWSLVCDAIGCGRQLLLLRKGGIAEGREGFAFRHDRFWLFPTAFHAQAEQLRFRARPEWRDPAGDGDPSAPVRIRHACQVTGRAVLTDWDRIFALAPFHVWKEEVVRERFAYGGQNALHLALIRAWRLETEWVFPREKRFGGCRSWLELPEAPASLGRLEPVPVDAAAEAELRAVAGLAAPVS